MRARQGPTTELAVPHEAAFAEVLDAHGYLHIPQLAHIEVDGSNPCPAEKDIAGRLHEILSTHHSLGVVGIGAWPEVTLVPRCPCLVDLPEGRGAPSTCRGQGEVRTT